MDQATDTDLLDILQARASSYAFLARVYRQEPSRELLKTLMATSAVQDHANVSEGNRRFHHYLRELVGQDVEQAVTQLSAEYAGLFLNVGRRPVYPFESVYTSDEKILMQRAYDEVRAEYRRAGLERAAGFDEPEDHLAFELDFMAYLCQKAMDALQAKQVASAVDYLKQQNEFFEKHLSVWVPRFCQDLAKSAETDFYKGIASLTTEFLDAERETLPMLIAALT